jgi:hypothetical protein
MIKLTVLITVKFSGLIRFRQSHRYIGVTGNAASHKIQPKPQQPMEPIMKKIIIALAALSALSTASFAERSWDLRDSPESQGTFSDYVGGLDNSTGVSTDIELLASGSSTFNAIAIDEQYDSHGFSR